MLMNADGTDKKRLTSNGRQDRQPVFSPDGARIAFASSRSGETEIWVMRADGTGVKRLTDFAAIDKTTGRQANPHFSPDGSQVFFQGTTYNNVPWGDDAVYRTDSFTGGPEHPTRLITLHGLYDMRGFAFNASGTQWTYGVRESFQLQVAKNPLHALDPRWGPFNLHVSPAEGGCGYCAGGAKYSFPGRKIVAKKSGIPEDFFTPVYAPAGDLILYLARLDESGSKPLLATVSVSDPTKRRPLQMDTSGGHASQIQPDWGPRPRP
jgi:dipeptidyl aminopeptidase/acylaminoacyl peptidase